MEHFQLVTILDRLADLFHAVFDGNFLRGNIIVSYNGTDHPALRNVKTISFAG